MAIRELDIKPLSYVEVERPANTVVAAKWSKLLVSVSILAIGLFYLTTIRQGHNWGDDFSLYIQHAKNIAQGVSFRNGSYLHFPPYVGPDAYPPIFPVLLAPIYAVFGLNLTAMKVEIIFLFLISLFVFIQIVKKDLTTRLQVALILIIGLNPYFWDLKDQIMSELPFLATAYLSIYLIYKAYHSHATGISKALYAIAIGLTFYLAYGTRSVGIVLVGCFVLGDLLHKRKLTLFSVGVVALTGTLIILQSFLLRSDRGYYDQIGANSEGFLYNWMIFTLNNAVSYTNSLTELWDNGYSQLPRLALTVIISGLAVIGYLARARKQITYIEIFTVLYPIVVVCAPMEGGIRYLIPIIPFYLFYAIQGVMKLPLKETGRNLTFAVLAVAIAISYAAKYSRVDFKEISGGISKAEAVEFFNYVNEQTSENDVFIFTKPRALALFTGRKSSYYPMSLKDKGLWEYFQRIKATHIVVGPKGLEPYDQAFLIAFVEKYKESLEEIHSNEDFKVYRVAGVPDAMGRAANIRPRWIHPPLEKQD